MASLLEARRRGGLRLAFIVIRREFGACNEVEGLEFVIALQSNQMSELVDDEKRIW